MPKYLLPSSFLIPSKQAAEFDESKHNRGGDGKFAPKGGGASKKIDKDEKKDLYSEPKARPNMTEAQARKAAEKQPELTMNQAAKKFTSLVESRLDKYGAKDYVLGGSYAKGTYIGKDADIDLFVRFPTSLTDEEFKQKTLDMGKDVLDDYVWYQKYGEHPYTEGFIGQRRVNIVGVFDVKKGQYRSAADRSPYHVEYINSKLSDSQKQDAKKLKQTFKGLGIYGANQKTNGFSGYSTELLVDKHKSYDGVMKYFANTTKSFELIDPVDKSRHLEVAMSSDVIDTLTLHSRGLSLSKNVLSPSTTLDLTKITNDNEDSQAGQRSKYLKKMTKALHHNGFSVLYTDVKDGKAQIHLESDTLPKYKKMVGPPIKNQKGTEMFIQAHSSDTTYVDNGQIYAVVERPHTSAKKLLESLSKNASLEDIT